MFHVAQTVVIEESEVYEVWGTDPDDTQDPPRPFRLTEMKNPTSLDEVIAKFERMRAKGPYKNLQLFHEKTSRVEITGVQFRLANFTEKKQ